MSGSEPFTTQGNNNPQSLKLLPGIKGLAAIASVLEPANQTIDPAMYIGKLGLCSFLRSAKHLACRIHASEWLMEGLVATNLTRPFTRSGFAITTWLERNRIRCPYSVNIERSTRKEVAGKSLMRERRRRTAVPVDNDDQKKCRCTEPPRQAEIPSAGHQDKMRVYGVARAQSSALRSLEVASRNACRRNYSVSRWASPALLRSQNAAITERTSAWQPRRLQSGTAAAVYVT